MKIKIHLEWNLKEHNGTWRNVKTTHLVKTSQDKKHGRIWKSVVAPNKNTGEIRCTCSYLPMGLPGTHENVYNYIRTWSDHTIERIGTQSQQTKSEGNSAPRLTSVSFGCLTNCTIYVYSHALCTLHRSYICQCQVKLATLHSTDQYSKVNPMPGTWQNVTGTWSERNEMAVE